MFNKKKKCTAQTVGFIKKVHLQTSPGRRLVVEYIVDGESYTLKENITVRSEAIKFGPFIIGQRKIEYVPEGVGGFVSVNYNPNKPSQACLTDNIGKYV